MTKQITTSTALITISDRAKALDTSIRGIKAALTNAVNKALSIEQGLESQLNEIIALSQVDDGRYAGKFDRAAAMANALSVSKPLLKKWVSLCEGRIPHKFTTDKVGVIVLSKRDNALLLSEEQREYIANKKADELEAKKAKAKADAESRKAKLLEHDVLKAELETARKAAIPESKAAFAKLKKENESALKIAATKENEAKKAEIALAASKNETATIKTALEKALEQIERLQADKESLSAALVQAREKILRLEGAVIVLEEKAA